MRIEVQPGQTNGVERVKRFVNVHLHCIVSNLKKISKFRRCHLWKNFCRRPCMYWFRSDSWVIKRGAVWFKSF